MSTAVHPCPRVLSYAYLSQGVRTDPSPGRELLAEQPLAEEGQYRANDGAHHHKDDVVSLPGPEVSVLPAYQPQASVPTAEKISTDGDYRRRCEGHANWSWESLDCET